MAKKSAVKAVKAVKKDSSKKTPAKATTQKKDVGKKKTVAKPARKTVARNSAKKKKSTNKTTPKVIKTLLSKGKKQGYLTYDEINEVLPEDLLSPEQIDETLMLFDANNIEVVDQKHKKKVVKLKKTRAKKEVAKSAAASDFGLSLIHISEPTRQVLVSRMPSSA